MNVSKDHTLPEEIISKLFSLLGQTSRLQILWLIGEGEACVCHLKEALGKRQAYISQQLMILRKAGLVIASREGRNIYYRLSDLRLLGLVQMAAEISGTPLPEIRLSDLPGCPYHPSRGSDGSTKKEGRSSFIKEI